MREASGADAALAEMAGEPPGVVVCDMGMPTHDGRWLARRLLSVCPDTSVVMYSEAADMDAARFCITHGVVDYLVKPFAREHLRESLRLGAEAWRDSVRARGRRAQAERALRERMAAVKRILAAGSQSEADIDALLASAIAEDPCAVRRARRVSGFAARLARVRRVRESQVAVIRQAAWLQEVGWGDQPRESQPDAELRHDACDLDSIRLSLLSEALDACPRLADASEVVRSTHERFDGRWRPRGLRSDEIPLGARIVAAAVAFDAAIHPEGDRWARSQAEAILQLQRQRGTHLNPAVVDALVEVVMRRGGRSSSPLPALVHAVPGPCGTGVGRVR